MEATGRSPSESLPDDTHDETFQPEPQGKPNRDVRKTCGDVFEYKSKVRSINNDKKLIRAPRAVSVYKEVQNMILSGLKTNIQDAANESLQSYRSNVTGHLKTLGAYVLSDFVYQLRPAKNARNYPHSAPERGRSNQRLPLACAIVENDFTIEFQNKSTETFCLLHHIATSNDSEGFGYAKALLSKVAAKVKGNKVVVFIPPTKWINHKGSRYDTDPYDFFKKLGFYTAKFTYDHIETGVRIMTASRYNLKFQLPKYVTETYIVSHYDPSSISKMVYGPKGWDGQVTLKTYRDSLHDKNSEGKEGNTIDSTFYGFHETFGWRDIGEDDIVGVSKRLLDALKEAPCEYSKQLVGKRRLDEGVEDDLQNQKRSKKKMKLCVLDETDMSIMCRLPQKNPLLPRLNKTFTSTKNMYCVWYSACLSLESSKYNKMEQIFKYYMKQNDKDCFKEMSFVHDSIVPQECSLEFHLRNLGFELHKYKSPDDSIQLLDYILSDDFSDNIIINLVDQNCWSGHCICIDGATEIKIILDPSEKTALELTLDNLSRCCGDNCEITSIQAAFRIQKPQN